MNVCLLITLCIFPISPPLSYSWDAFAWVCATGSDNKPESADGLEAELNPVKISHARDRI